MNQGSQSGARGDPHIVVAFMGLPGAGKSSVARHLLAHLPLHRVDRDGVRAALFPRCTYTDEEKAAANAAVLAAVRANCRLGRASLVDGMTFARAQELAALRARVVADGFTLLPLWLDVAPEVARARIASQRSAHVARDRAPDLVDRVAARFEAPPPDARRIAADRPLEEVCAAALALVRDAMAGS